MKSLYELKDRFYDELDEIARKPEFSSGDLETAQKLTDTIKNIDKICMLENGGYSRDGEWTAHGNYGNDNSYEGRRRDSRGRYSRDGSKEHMISKLEDMLDDSDNERTKSAIKKCINEIKRD